MKISLGEKISALLTIASFGVATIIYPLLPEKVASHWNAAGDVNGYMSRFWGAYLLPVILTVMLVLFFIIPRIDPKKENIAAFRTYFDRFIILMMVFMAYIYGLTIAWNLGYQFELIRLFSPAIALLFYYAGVLTEHAEMNWFIGIRTPWTLSSPTVWTKTNQLGGKLFKASGIFALGGLLFPSLAIWLILVPAMATAVWSILYSYIEYQKEKKV